MSSTVIELREPFKTYFAQLDAIKVVPGEVAGAWTVCVGRMNWFNMPPLEKEEATALAAEIDAAVQPIIKRFRGQKMAEIIGASEPRGASTSLISRVLGR